MTDPFTRPPIFPSFAALFRPADPTIRWEVIEVGPDWRPTGRPTPDVAALAWGRMPGRGRPTPSHVVAATRREIALIGLRSRPPARLRVVGSQRLAPVRRPGRVRTAIRDATMGGVIVELARGDRPERRIDVVARRAGAVVEPRLRPSGDGSALAHLTTAEGRALELRIAVAGHAKDPLRGRAALQALETADVPLVPRPVDGDETAGTRWATETVMAGDHPRTLDATLLADVVDLLARLPTGDPLATSLNERMTRLASVFPRHAAVLAAAASSAARWAAGQPTVLEHGDVWLNNLFVADGRLVGLIDWDTWHPSGLAGADVLSLIAQDERARRRGELGDLLVDGFWDRPTTQAVLASYFAARGAAGPDRAGRAAIAIGWWATAISSAIDRAFRPATDPGWVARNVDAPAAALEGWLATFE
jgi:aminoglycoside phosphotransferase (APT) family kinase protein